jgi:hypothetical protein
VCAAQNSGPNGADGAIDAMISVIAHEQSEMVTDPQLNGWYDAQGMENAGMQRFISHYLTSDHNSQFYRYQTTRQVCLEVRIAFADSGSIVQHGDERPPVPNPGELDSWRLHGALRARPVERSLRFSHPLRQIIYIATAYSTLYSNIPSSSFSGVREANNSTILIGGERRSLLYTLPVFL